MDATPRYASSVMRHDEARRNLLGIGVYSRRDAATLLRVRLRKLNRWVHGYRYTSSGGRYGWVPPVVPPELGGDEEEALSFRDLIELLFVAGFRRQGLSLQYVRKAAGIAAEKYQSRHPFCLRRFSTDGRRIFATLEEERVEDLPGERKKRVEEVVSGQLVFRRVVEQYLRQLEYDVETGETIRWWPMGRETSVALDPTRAFGEPIDVVTGVPTSSIYRAYRAEGEGRAARLRISEWFEAPLPNVDAAIEFEERFRAAAV